MNELNVNECEEVSAAPFHALFDLTLLQLKRFFINCIGVKGIPLNNSELVVPPLRFLRLKKIQISKDQR